MDRLIQKVKDWFHFQFLRISYPGLRKQRAWLTPYQTQGSDILVSWSANRHVNQTMFWTSSDGLSIYVWAWVALEDGTRIYSDPPCHRVASRNPQTGVVTPIQSWWSQGLLLPEPICGAILEYLWRKA